MKKILYKTTLDKFGRVLIPKKMRMNLGLSPGCDLNIEAHDKEITIHPITEESLLVNKEGVLVAKCDAVEPIEGFEKKIRNQRLKKLSGVNVADFKRVTPEKLLQTITSQ